MDAAVGEMVSGVPATMLITVSARALAHVERPEMGFRDPFAEQVVASLGIDPREYCTHGPMLTGTVFRSVFFDRVARAFFERHRNGVGINLACGLGTNYDRVAAEAGEGVDWFDVDLAEVMEVRRRYFPDTKRRRAVEGDLTDPWLFSRLLSLTGPRPALVLMEGVLFYFAPAQVEAVFARLGAALDGVGCDSELAFDVVSPSGLARVNALNTDVQRTETVLVWACRGASELLGWDRRLELVEIGDHGAFLPPEAQPSFEDARRRDGLAPLSVMHFRRVGSHG